MNKFVKITGLVALTGAILVGCSSKEEPKKEEPVKTEAPVEAPAENTEVTEVAAGPTLTGVEWVQDGNNVTVSFNVEGIVFSAENYGGDHVEGEGHAHVYVNGEKIGGLKEVAPYTFENLEAGTHELKLSLQKNDHEYYNVQEVFSVTVE